MDGFFSTFACCNDRSSRQNERSDTTSPTFLITCFNEQDKEITDLKIPANTSWPEMSAMISQALGEPAIFVYDDGSGIDFPVRSDKEFIGFLSMVRSNKNVHGEYDIMLLPAGDWARYDRQQKAALAASTLNGKDYQNVYAAIGHLKECNLITAEEENTAYKIVPVSDKEVVSAYRSFQVGADHVKFAQAIKLAVRHSQLQHIPKHHGDSSGQHHTPTDQGVLRHEQNDQGDSGHDRTPTGQGILRQDHHGQIGKGGSGQDHTPKDQENKHASKDQENPRQEEL